MWHPWAGGFWWIFPLLFWLLILFVAIRVAWGCGFGRRWSGRDGRAEAEAILQRRLAAGEIDEAEYRRIRAVLGRG